MRTRMLVPAAKHDEALAIAKATAENVKPGDPFGEEPPWTGCQRSSVEQDSRVDPGHR